MSSTMAAMGTIAFYLSTAFENFPPDDVGVFLPAFGEKALCDFVESKVELETGTRSSWFFCKLRIASGMTGDR